MFYNGNPHRGEVMGRTCIAFAIAGLVVAALITAFDRSPVSARAQASAPSMVVLNRATCEVLGEAIGRVADAKEYCRDVWLGTDLQFFSQCLRAADTDSDGWRNCPDSLSQLVEPLAADFEPMDHDLNSVAAGFDLLVIAFESPGSPNSPMTFSSDKGAFFGLLGEFTCAGVDGSPIYDVDCFFGNDLVPADGVMAARLEIPPDAPLGAGHVTITQEGASTTEEFVVTGPAASLVVEAISGGTALLSESDNCEYPATAGDMRDLAVNGTGDPRVIAFLTRIFDSNGVPIVWYAWWTWPFVTNGNAVFVGGKTITMDLGPGGLGAIQLVCGITPGQEPSSVWAGAPFAPPALYQNITVTVLDPALNQDGDACANGHELAANPVIGGDRDPLDPWDFYDVTGDKTVDLDDALVILEAFGRTPGHPEYNNGLDRQANDPMRPWRTAPAAGDQIGIDLQDALLNLQSFGHNCN